MVITPEIYAILTTIVGIVVSVLTGYLSHRLQKFSDENREYRREREQKEDAEAEKRRIRDEANDRLTLGIARMMLLDNYKSCVQKGFYSPEEREVFHEMWQAYRADNGNGVIAQIANKIVELPTEPPKQE